jgi:hypothetical protein
MPFGGQAKVGEFEIAMQHSLLMGSRHAARQLHA